MYEALIKMETDMAGKNNMDVMLNAFLPMIPKINRFFDDVLVMVDDEDLRHNRLGLLQRISSTNDGIADLSRLEGF